MDYIASLVHGLLKATLAVPPVTETATATYQFNPSVSQEEACQRAEDRAKEKALLKVFGQEFAADSTMSCREGTQYKCDSIVNTYSNTRGYIESLTKKSEKVDGWSCTVEVSASMRQLKPRKTTLEAQAILDRVVYTADDKVRVTIQTNTSGIVTLFHYDPIVDKLTKIYPTSNTKTALWTHNTKALTVDFPANSFGEKTTPHYIFATVTGGPIPTMSNYRLHEFYKMWDNLPYNDVTFVRKSFYVSRSNL